MSNLGFSVYVSTYETQKDMLNRFTGSGTPIFISLHISEEFGENYCKQAENICKTLSKQGFRIIADVSVKTVEQFGRTDLVSLGKEFGIWALRIDYGFSDEEIMNIGKYFPIVLNASTTSQDSATSILQNSDNVMAMHNFYPRPETGLDELFFKQSTYELNQAGLKVLAFIPGDEQLRGPIYEGLPTLESHRFCPPSVSFIDLAVNFGINDIFVGDPSISINEQNRISRFCNDKIIEIPSILEDKYKDLYGKIFTCRADSPSTLIRFAESRMYSCISDGKPQNPANCNNRTKGAITLDNLLYDRYAGEIQITRSSMKADKRVNVIGYVNPAYIKLIDCVKNGCKFTLTP